MLKVRPCHKVKVWPPFFEAVLSGDKTFEVRKDDRNYQVGDSHALFKWSPDTNTYTGLFSNFRIVYKLDGGQFGIEKGYCCLGIAPISKSAESAPKSPNMPSAKSCDYCSEPDDALGSICKKCLQRFMERSA